MVYENNLERLHAQADEEEVILSGMGLTDLIEEQRASHGALVSRLNDMFIKHLESTWVPRTLHKIAAEKKKIQFEHAVLGMPPAHQEEALPLVRDAIVKAVEGVMDRAVPSLLDTYSKSVLHPMKRDIQRVVKQAIMDTFKAQGAEWGVKFNTQVDSQILSPPQRVQVCSWLQDADLVPEPTKLVLLYRASRDGWGGKDFHSRCDGKGATVAVIKCSGGFVFGGYADTSWSSDGNWTSSPQAFLFSLHRPSGVGPVKLPQVQNHRSKLGKQIKIVNGKAICCNSCYGPKFGDGDLFVDGDVHGSTNLGQSYQLPAKQSAQTFFTGAHKFQAAEVEVYQVQLQ